MSRKFTWITILSTIIILLFSMIFTNVPALAAEKITIGWAPPDITGVFKTATDYFEKSAEDAAMKFL